MKLKLLTAFLVLAMSCAAFAQGPLEPTNVALPQGQTVYNPTAILFDSPDHAIACPTDRCVASYRVEFWLQGVDPATGTPVSSYALAKSVVTPSGLPPDRPQLQANLSALTPLYAIPVGATYVARMIAVGLEATPGSPLLSPRSDASNPFESAGAPRSLANVQIR